MKKYLYFIFIMLFMIFNDDVYASGGKLKSASIKSCNGVMYGQHSDHWHVAEETENGYYPVGDAIYSNPCASSVDNNSSSDNNDYSTNNTTTTTKQETTTQTTKKKTTTATTTTQKPKNNDNTLKEITIDDKNIEIKDTMDYTTTKETVDVKVITNDDKASYEIKNNSNLSIGNNEIVIEVKAEDETVKNYIINVKREIILSSNKNIKIIINDEEVIFNNYKATVYVTHKETTFDLDYVLEDEKSKIELDKIKDLKVGDNDYKIKVIAEDGSEQIYNVIIYRSSKIEDVVSNVLAWGIIGGFGYGIYFVIKKGKIFLNKLKNRKV